AARAVRQGLHGAQDAGHATAAACLSLALSPLGSPQRGTCSSVFSVLPAPARRVSCPDKGENQRRCSARHLPSARAFSAAITAVSRTSARVCPCSASLER